MELTPELKQSSIVAARLMGKSDGPDYRMTYCSNAGRHEDLKNAIHAAKLIPHSGSVENPAANPRLETYRIASNCYYDLYNNGLRSRAQEFRKAFGFSATKLMERKRGLGWALTQEVIDRTETKMDDIILRAYKEQFTPLI